jgi:hypothetical protein
MTTTLSTNYWNATAASTVAPCVVTRPRHTPGIKLTQDQRDAKSEQHKFGLCCDCDAGLDDRADFVLRKHFISRLVCNDCSEYYTDACTALRVRRLLAKMNDCEGDSNKGGGEDGDDYEEGCEPEKGDH